MPHFLRVCPHACHLCGYTWPTSSQWELIATNGMHEQGHAQPQGFFNAVLLHEGHILLPFSSSLSALGLIKSNGPETSQDAYVAKTFWQTCTCKSHLPILGHAVNAKGSSVRVDSHKTDSSSVRTKQSRLEILPTGWVRATLRGPISRYCPSYKPTA